MANEGSAFPLLFNLTSLNKIQKSHYMYASVDCIASIVGKPVINTSALANTRAEATLRDVTSSMQLIAWGNKVVAILLGAAQTSQGLPCISQVEEDLLQ